MERIKLAILQAKETANRQRLEPSRAAMDRASSSNDAAMATSSERSSNGGRRRVEPQRRPRTVVVLLLLCVAAVLAFRALTPEPATAPKVAAMQAVAVSATAPVAAAVAPAQATEPTEPEKLSAPNDPVVAAVEAWRQAWSKRDMVNYLNAYSEAFTPSEGGSREDWVASRHRNVGGRKAIDVQIKRLLVTTHGDGNARATFLQDYTSGGHRELGRPKTLDLVREADNQWRIVGEWQGDPPPNARAGKS